ncbi:MAG TPA: phytoene/squalene synthase family protein [Methylovirgula sp.]
MVTDAYATCDELIHREDKDRWLATLFLPEEKRPYVQALYAFSLEIARVRRLVTEPALGEMRFQWWREVLSGERGGEALAHPVAAALLDTLKKNELSAAPLLALIDARLFDLFDEPMPTLEALETYASATAGTLFRLGATILDPKADDDTSEAADHAGIAYAVTGLMRALPWHGLTGQLYLPADLLRTNGAVAQAVQAGVDSPALRNALAELRGLVRMRLAAFARVAARNSAAAAAFLPASLCELYLKEMERRGYQPFETVIRAPQWRRQWRLWRAAKAIR